MATKFFHVRTQNSVYCVKWQHDDPKWWINQDSQWKEIYMIAKYGRRTPVIMAYELPSEKLFPGKQIFFVTPLGGDNIAMGHTSIVAEIHQIPSFEDFLKNIY